MFLYITLDKIKIKKKTQSHLPKKKKSLVRILKNEIFYIIENLVDLEI